MMATRWKAFERDVAALLGGKRFWANSGEALDVESEGFVAQCKEVKTCSLAALTDLAETAERQGTVKLKAGVVAIRGKRGPGRPKSPILVVMTEATFRYLHGYPVDVVANATPTAARGGRG